MSDHNNMSLSPNQLFYCDMSCKNLFFDFIKGGSVIKSERKTITHHTEHKAREKERDIERERERQRGAEEERDIEREREIRATLA